MTTQNDKINDTTPAISTSVFVTNNLDLRINEHIKERTDRYAKI